MILRRVFVTGGSGFLGKQLIHELVSNNITVIALSRSQKTDENLKKCGAIPMRGNLHDRKILIKGIEKCDAVFHLAAVTMRAGGSDHEFYHTNVLGTENILFASKKAGVKKFIFVSSEAVLLGGKPIINADETWTTPKRPIGIYGQTKAVGEQKVLEANSTKFETIILRPRLIWGKDSKGMLGIIEKARTGKFAFIDHGKQLTSTCHVKNVCEALLLAAKKGKGGQIYFISDGEPVTMHEFINNILAAKHIPRVDKSIPYWLAYFVASVLELIWKIFNIKHSPPLTQATVSLLGNSITVNDRKARKELGYVGSMTMKQGYAEFAD